jgi:peptidoglycan biosynthesis protein MviN/MurJ (putative lipid II flippase)
LIGIDRKWGAPGLTLAVGLTAWLELVLLRRAIQKKIGAVPSFTARIFMLWMAAAAAAIASLGLFRILPKLHPTLMGLIVLVFYCLLYLLLTQLMKISSVGADRIPEPN